MSLQRKDATTYTKQANAAYLSQLPFDNKQDFEDSQRGFIATVEGDGVRGADGHLVWDLKGYAFEGINDPCPDTVNPSLWRQAQLNNIHGLFKIMDGVYQVRNLDMGNMTIIEGDTGIIIVDCTTANETAAAGLALYEKHVGKKDIKAICITHSHTDHYGGIAGLISAEDALSGRIPIYVPANFMFEVVSENAYAGNIMSRRTYDQYGTILEKGPKSQVDAGLGKGLGDRGTHSIFPPSHIIKEPVETHVLDGVTFEFMLTPHTEAPAEFILFFPEKKLLLPGEIVTHTFHNLYTLRGAEVRDARLWWKAVDKMIENYGDKTDIVCAVHHWPTYGHERSLHLLEVTRDSYKCIHDQSLRMMNQGLTMLEVAEEFSLPDSLGKEWAMRGYYGSWNHSAKAVYQKYLGWFDMNPAHLHPLPPEPAAKKYVEAMGGPAAVLAKTQAAFDAGEYRWAAELGNQLIFADPTNVPALTLQADIYEQMGYQCENGTWRCVYLMGATELRMAAEGKRAHPETSTINPALAGAMSDDMFFDFVALHLNTPRAANDLITLNVTQTDKKTTWALQIKNGVLNFHQDKKYPSFDAAVQISRDDFARLVLGMEKADVLIQSGKIKVDGNSAQVVRFFSLFDVFSLDINIMTP